MQAIHAAQSQRIVGSDHGKVNSVSLCKIHDSRNILGTDLGDTDSISSDAAVAGQSIDGLHSGIFFQLFDNGVLAAAAANNEKIHKRVLLIQSFPPFKLRCKPVSAEENEEL